MTLTQGQEVAGRYRVVSQLGQGGMGAVYRAWDARLNISVALKEMVPQPGLAPHVLAQRRQQFQQEATILARLDHPNLVDVTDFFEEGSSAYLVMRLVEGRSLANLIEQQGALPERQVLAWAGQLLDALAYCHSRGVIHRDIKPQNIIVRPDGQAILVDFGLVKLWDPRDPRTQTAMQGMGTPQYAPPEQYGADPGHTDPRSDVYGLGATLYHTLTARIPPTATDRMADPDSFVSPRRLNPGVSPRTEAVVLQALQLARANRFPGAQQMAAALRGAVPLTPTPIGPASPPATRSRRRVPVFVWALGGLTGVVAIALVVFVAVMALAGDGQQTVTKPPSTREPLATPQKSPTAIATTPAPVVSSPLPPTAEALSMYVEYILDGSNGMMSSWGGEGEPKLLAAQRALVRHWQAFGPSVHMGLRMYGHRYDAADEASCRDGELLVPLHANNFNALGTQLQAVQARGMDSLAEALRLSLADFDLLPDRVNAVVLLSDGGDTCGGDPVQVVEAQRETGVRLPIYIIGLGVDPDQREQLLRAAEASDGRYFDVSDADKLNKALDTIAGILSEMERLLTVVHPADSSG